jgi:hypothetical protein
MDEEMEKASALFRAGYRAQIDRSSQTMNSFRLDLNLDLHSRFRFVSGTLGRGFL